MEAVIQPLIPPWGSIKNDHHQLALFFSSNFLWLFLKNSGWVFLMHHCFPVIMPLQFKQLRLFSPNLICKDSKAQIPCTSPTARCKLGAPSCLHLVFGWHRTMSIKFFDWSFFFNHWYCFQCICFPFKFHCFSFLSGLWGENDTTNHFIMISVLGGGISILVL